VPKPRSLPPFARRLRTLRGAAGLSQAGLAAKAGLHPRAVAHLEQGVREPAWRTACLLADALGVGVQDFRAK
jgi:transcriptional regulator with XRE-family HTH domain